MRDLFYERFGDISRIWEIYFAIVVEMNKNICRDHLPAPYDTKHGSGRVCRIAAQI
jgi:hypothetical protein